MLNRLRSFFSGSSQADEPPPTVKIAVEDSPADEPSAMEDPQAYLGRVQDKINGLAEEFASGRINRPLVGT